jgi:hypothetical protein
MLGLRIPDVALTWYTELKVRQHDTTNTTSSEPDGWMTIFSPQMEVSVLTMDMPGELTTNPVYPSPVTEITKLSLGVPAPEVTETTTQDSVSQTKQPKPVIQPTGISLIVPVTDTVSDKTSFITVVPTAHIESSATFIAIPGVGTTTASRAPKMPHLEDPGSQLDQPPQPTDSPSASNEDDDVNRGTSGLGASASQPTQAGVVVPGETASSIDEANTGSQTQGDPASQQGSVTTGDSNGQPAGQHGSIVTGGSNENAEPSTSPTFAIDNTPLVAGGSPVTVDRTTYSLDSTASAIVVNGNTMAFETDMQGQAVLPIGQHGSTTIGLSNGNAGSSASPTFVIDNTPLVAGGSPITVEGTTYSLTPTGSAVVVNGITVSFTTDSRGRAVPVGSTANASAGDPTETAAIGALGSLSVAPADDTATGETSKETGSAGEQRSSSASGPRGTSPTSTTSGDDERPTATSNGSAPADNVGASNLPWSISAIVGAIGLLVMVV